jgi:hypothetical protein
MADVNPDVKGGAGLDVSDFRDEVHTEADAVFVGKQGERGKQRERSVKVAKDHGNAVWVR